MAVMDGGKGRSEVAVAVAEGTLALGETKRKKKEASDSITHA